VRDKFRVNSFFNSKLLYHAIDYSTNPVAERIFGNGFTVQTGQARQSCDTLKIMLHNLTITVDDAVYQTLKPMIEQQTIGAFLSDVLRYRPCERAAPSIRAMRGTLHHVDTSDLRDEADRPL
jgi:hypothetical protein